MTSVTIIQPWLPLYRVPFFTALTQRLAREGVDLTVAHGSARGDEAARADSVSPEWAVPLRQLGRANGRLVWHRAAAVIAGSDLVIAEQAIRNVETYALAARSRIRGPAFALWGHGRTYTTEQRGHEVALKNALTRQASWFFAYTAGGAQYVAAHGFPRERITVVQNSIDTEWLKAQAQSANAFERAEIRSRLGIPEGRFAMFLGALDDSKRIDVVLANAEAVVDVDPSFHLVLAGTGSRVDVVRNAASRHAWISYVGPLTGRDKAVATAEAELIVMPGRVGLAAVDSFAAGTPIVTCAWPWHAPEFEYLEHGINSWVTADDPISFRDGVITVWQQDDLRRLLSSGTRASAGIYTLSAMVENFAAGVMTALDAASRR